MTSKQLDMRLVTIRSSLSEAQVQKDNDIYPRVLISMFHTCKTYPERAKRFLNKLNKISKIRSHKLYIDSGGYSIIAGLIPKTAIDDLIDTYYTLTENISDESLDYIFSLDIPFSIKYTDLNEVNTIYTYNKKVQERYVDTVTNKNPIYKKKAMFVWQWKTINLFNVWYKVFNELQLYKYYELYSIGGLVGLKKMQNLDHSPYVIPLAFIFSVIRNYYDDNEIKSIAKKHDDKYIFHILGQGGSPIEHMVVPILEKVFQRMFDFPTEIYMTFDTAAIEANFMSAKDEYCLEYDECTNKYFTHKNHIQTTIDSTTGRIIDSDALKYALYLTRANLEKYFQEKYLDRIVELVLNITTGNQILKAQKKLHHILQQDKLLITIVGYRNLSDFISTLGYLMKYKIKVFDKNLHKDIEYNKQVLEQYITKIVRLSELLRAA
jgi:hypothetical protein